DNVRRIRHHASLALWCGNNEMEWGWESWSWDKPEYADLKTGYDVYFHYLLPQWIKDLDPDTAYWPSSPSSDQPFKNVNGQIQGDAHYWDVWHQGAPFTAYRDQYPRFMSEFGFQSFPPMETIKTYAKPEDWNLTSPVMESHQKNNNGNRFIINQMTATYRVPTNFESLMYMSMVLQAEGIRYGVEHWRRNNHRVSGTLYWQLNDCWPVASWASIDYFGRWKALHYSAKRFYEPVLLSLFDEGSHISIHLTNDTVNKWDGQISWAWTKLDGEILESGQKPISVTALKSAEVEVVDLPVTKELERDSIFICNLVQNGVTVSTQISTFIPTKQLNLTEANLDWQITQSGDQFHLRLKTSSLSRFIELKLEGADVIFSDNYFDLPAGQERVITCAIPEGWTLDHAKQSFRWTDVYHSYAA
ncbi:MAG: glycoside hydrolase family 2 protein, partial [Anaerolineaceae bacterium]|nr:glycoside hydrolase family 2 protein [Anaerolineaceae bacterium]